MSATAGGEERGRWWPKTSREIAMLPVSVMPALFREVPLLADESRTVRVDTPSGTSAGGAWGDHQLQSRDNIAVSFPRVTQDHYRRVRAGDVTPVWWSMWPVWAGDNWSSGMQHPC